VYSSATDSLCFFQSQKGCLFFTAPGPGPGLFYQFTSLGCLFDTSQSQAFFNYFADTTPLAGSCFFKRLVQIVIKRYGEPAHKYLQKR
jgi:hypothetical protein